MHGLAWLWIVFGATLAFSSQAEVSTRHEVEAALSKPVVRGGIVFKSYCVVCHGETANGRSRASRLYGIQTLQIRKSSDLGFDKIIRLGGKAVGKSPFMPPWSDELSEEQIKDVIAYLKVVSSSPQRGEVVFKTNCILCHGLGADGKGRAAKLYNPPPADLTHSDKNDEYKESIIRLGGAAMGRSEFMPVWGEQLSDQEIKDLVAYLATVVKK